MVAAGVVVYEMRLINLVLELSRGFRTTWDLTSCAHSWKNCVELGCKRNGSLSEDRKPYSSFGDWMTPSFRQARNQEWRGRSVMVKTVEDTPLKERGDIDDWV
jgi:hypothetical protein